MSQLSDFSDGIMKIGEKRREGERLWFEQNKPIAEFSLKNANDDIETHYGVWNWGEDWCLMYFTEGGRYSLTYKIIISKAIVEKLSKLGVENK